MSWEQGWIALFVIGFIMEVIAIFNDKRGDTLSENVWNWFKIDKYESNWHLSRIVLTIGLVWLLFHFAWRNI